MKKQIFVPEGTDSKSMTYAPTVRIGDLLLLSGTAGCNSTGRLAGNDIESQARQDLRNLGKVLEAARSSWDKVVKVNCF